MQGARSPDKTRREFDLLGISVRVDMPGVGTVRLIRENGFHLFERRVERAVL